MKNKSQLEKLYILLGASIFVHYVLVILVCLLILENMIRTGEYRKIVKDRLLILIEIVLGFSLVMSVIYRNYMGLVAILILICIVVGRYYDLQINQKLKKENIDLIAKLSSIAFVISILEFIITRNRVGFFSYFNPNYLGSMMMMAATLNLYLAFKRKAKINLGLFVLNIATLFLTGSRFALIATVISIFVLLFYFLKKRNFLISLGLLITYAIGVYFRVLPFIRSETIEEYFWLRVNIMKTAIIIFQKTNILYGHGNFYYYKYTHHVYPHAHNTLIESLLSYGLIGTLILIAVFSKYIYGILRDDKNHILKIAIISGVIGHSLADVTIFWIQTVILFIIILSYDESYENIKDEDIS
jgi:O-antigen ligase